MEPSYPLSRQYLSCHHDDKLWKLNCPVAILIELVYHGLERESQVGY